MDEVERVWEIIGSVGVAMMTTQFAGGLRARPLEARPDLEAGVIWFLTDVRSGKDEEVAASPHIGLVFIDCRAQALSLGNRTCRDSARHRSRRRHLEKHRSGLVAGRAGRSDAAPAASRAEDRRAMGWAVKFGRCGLRICQGQVDRQQAESGSEPEDHRPVGLVWPTGQNAKKQHQRPVNNRALAPRFQNYLDGASGTQEVRSRSYLNPGAAFKASFVVSMVR
jgi:hypothetical protein